MRRFRFSMIALVALAAVVWGMTRPSDAEEGLRKRAPGTVVLRGNPDEVGAWRFERAFPNLRFRRPLWIGHAPDDTNRIFVMEQDGVIRVFPNDPGVRTSDVVLDIRGKVYRKHNEEGLLGLAFHPEFKSNRHVYIHYSANHPRRGVVSRFTMNRARTVIDPKSERVILEQRQPWGNHNGGDLQFGPDGYLYLSFGDGGAGGDPLGSGQDRSTWLGTLLRIDVDKGSPYSVPKDNPFVGEKGVQPEIWAYGLRNVWRFSFDRETGQLWAGDVGQNAWEEIDLITKGGNYGWNAREGAHPYRRRRQQRDRVVPKGPFIDPVIELDTSLARSITGGYVYRGTRWPALRGIYLYADYATSNVWGLRHDGVKVIENRLIGRGASVSSFGEDQAGEVYFTAFDGYVYGFAQRGKPDPAERFPQLLSETGLFVNTRTLQPAPALIPYEVNVPLWSDGAGKQRYIMLPGTSRIEVTSEGTYTYPVGTIFVKSFFAGEAEGGRRLETRLFLRRESGWAGYTYVWNDEQTDAELFDGRRDLELPSTVRKRTGMTHWTVPSRGDCMSCHTEAAGFVLGFRPEQLQRTVRYGGTERAQLTEMTRIGLFEGHAADKRPAWPRWDAAAAPRTAKVRAYLDSNCAACHQPGAPGNASIDLRYDTPFERMRLQGHEPGEGDLGVRGARLLTPGKASRSILWLRMNRTDEQGMPNLAHNRVDAEAVRLVREWINKDL